MKEFTIRAGKDRNIPITVSIVTKEETGFGGKKYPWKKVVSRVKGEVPVEAMFRHFEHGTVARVSSVWTKELGEILGRKVPRKDILLSISDEDLERVKALQEEVEEENKATYQQMKESTPLVFRIEEANPTLVDMSYEAIVFMPSKNVEEMTEEEKERYRNLQKAIDEFGNHEKHEITHDLWPNSLIDARNFDPDMEYTLDDLEEIFSHCLRRFEEAEKGRKVEREREKREYEAKKAQALKKAKETGQDVPIAIVGYYDGDEVHPGSEEGLVAVWEYARPNGTITKKDVPSY